MWAWKFANLSIQSKKANFIGQYFGTSQNVCMMGIKTTMTKYFPICTKVTANYMKKKFKLKVKQPHTRFFFKNNVMKYAMSKYSRT
jgi:hypothetical protein